jgi:NADPH:quinone reductase-like Zn-dependent oxidoreductase
MQGKFNQVCCENGTFKLCQSELPKLQNNQVLVRVHFSSVNQFDKILMECKKDQNFVLGSEGSGIIEDVGAGVDGSFRGRKVAFCHDGWSQFCIKKLDEIILLDDNVDLRIAADAVTNPMTALCCLKLIR